jgi:putative NIF3 family GTP cyclohydrolase 1 type 2
VAGDPARIVDRVAVCGGSGDGLMAAAQSGGADVYLTSDLKHHRVQEFVQDNDCAIIDVVHYASEYPWCGQTAAALEHHLAEVGVRLPVTVSSSVTDPWTFRRGAQ